MLARRPSPFALSLLNNMRLEAKNSLQELQQREFEEKLQNSRAYLRIARWPTPYFFNGRRLTLFGVCAGVNLPFIGRVKSPYYQFSFLSKHTPKELESAMGQPLQHPMPVLKERE